MACLFCRIISGDLPTSILYQDDDVVAIRDVAPQAPSHLLVIPKRHIATIDDTKLEDQSLLGHMVLVAKQLAAAERLASGYRLIFNVNQDGGQAIYHIHLHILGGRQLAWPPG